MGDAETAPVAARWGLPLRREGGLTVLEGEDHHGNRLADRPHPWDRENYLILDGSGCVVDPGLGGSAQVDATAAAFMVWTIAILPLTNLYS
jgi:hypothetical protein